MADEKRRARIVEVAIKLSQRRGYDAVGLREVAEHAGVALGTLYKSFSSKEEIVGAAVLQQIHRLRVHFDRRPAEGEDTLARLDDLFSRLTSALTRRPALARTVLGAIGANHPAVTRAVLQHDEETTRIIVAAMRGAPPLSVDVESYTRSEASIAFLLRHVWFASMVGWSAKLHGRREVLEHVRQAARLLLAGAEALGEWPGGS